MIAEKDPIAVELFERYKQVRMPNLRVGDIDMDALINFLASEGRTTPTEQKPKTVEPKTGAALK
jgi:protein SCO1/2